MTVSEYLQNLLGCLLGHRDAHFGPQWRHRMDRRLGGETNREIDFGFGSVVRARGLVVRWE